MMWPNKLFFVLGLVLFFSIIIPIHSFAASPFMVGVINDCRDESNARLLEDIKKEVTSLTKGEFNVQFSLKSNIVSDCSQKKIKDRIDKLFKDPNINMLLAIGSLGSHVLGRYKNYPKPSIAAIVMNHELQLIPFKNGKSGKDNLTYVSMSPNLEDNIGQFKQLAPFKTAAVLYDKSIFQSMKPGKDFFEKLEKNTGTKLVLIPVGKEIESVKKNLDKTIDAVFIGNLIQLGSAGMSDLIAYINEKKLVSFSFYDRKLVEKGMLAGFDRTPEMARLSRRIAILIQRILLKENPKNFKVDFSRQQNLVINMQTADKLGISPGFALLTKAQLIRNEIPGTSKIKPGEQSKDTIILSDLVAGDSGELNIMSFGLNETGATLSLLDAVNLALKNNLVLKSRARETEAGKMNVKQALSKFFPQLGTGLSWTAIDDEHTSAISGVAERSWFISGRVSQLLYSDEVYTNLKTSRHLQAVQELSEYQERLDVILETVISYLNMLKTRAIAKIRFENLKLVRSNLVLANNRYQAGAAGPSDVYRLESEAAIAYSQFLDSLAKVGRSRVQLNQILNLDQEDNTIIQDVRLDDGLFIVSDPKTRAILKLNNPKDFRRYRDFIVKKGLGASPEIKAINEQIIIQDDAYNLARRSYFSPNVFVDGGIGNIFSKSGEGSDFDAGSLPGALSSVFEEPDDTSWQVSLNVEIPFYQGGFKSAAKIKALETRSQLTFFKYNIQNLISENIRSALYDLSSSHPSIELTRLSAKSAKKNLDLIQNAYSSGAVSIVNFLDAQNASLVSNLSAENAVYDFFIDFIISERAAANYTLFMSKDEREQWIQEFLQQNNP